MSRRDYPRAAFPADRCGVGFHADGRARTGIASTTIRRGRRYRQIFSADLTGAVKAARQHQDDWAGGLREVQLQMLQNPATAHPLFWGAFTLIGAG